MFPKRMITMGGDKFRDEWSLVFDGTNDYVELSGVFNYNVNSISCWFKPTAVAGASSLFDQRDANNDGIYLYLSDGDLNYQIDNVDGVYNFGRAATLGKWWHVVATNDGSISTLYLNGVSVETADTSGETIDIAGTYPARIGSRSHTSIGNHYTGNISETAFYNSALTANQAAIIYNDKEPYNHKEGVASANLKGWWRMGDGRLDDRSDDGSEGGFIGDEVVPTLGSNMFDAAASVFTSGTYGWVAYGSNTLANDSNTLKITWVDNNNGAYTYLRDAKSLSSDLTVGKMYKLTFDAKVNTGSATYDIETASGSDVTRATVTNTSFQTYILYFIAGSVDETYLIIRVTDGEIAWLDNTFLQEVGGNSGVMQNMDAVIDFEGDTP